MSDAITDGEMRALWLEAEEEVLAVDSKMLGKPRDADFNDEFGDNALVGLALADRILKFDSPHDALAARMVILTSMAARDFEVRQGVNLRDLPPEKVVQLLASEDGALRTAMLKRLGKSK
jgi:hypothetical protein